MKAVFKNVYVMVIAAMLMVMCAAPACQSGDFRHQYRRGLLLSGSSYDPGGEYADFAGKRACGNLFMGLCTVQFPVCADQQLQLRNTGRRQAATDHIQRHKGRKLYGIFYRNIL